MSDKILQFNKVRLQRNAKVLIDEITFNLEPGEHLAIIGQAGSGKSSMLEAIARKSFLRDGSVNHPLLEQEAASRRATDPVFAFYHLISFVPTKHDFRDLTNTANLYYQQRYNSADSESVATVGDHLNKLADEEHSGVWNLDLLENRLNLKALHQKQLIKLSNGETKRLLLAAALIKNPLLLLLDNPLTGLDPETRKDFGELLKEVADSGITVVMTTASGEIPEMITHVGVISNGYWQYLKQKDFNPAMAHSAHPHKPDEQKLKELLTTNEGSISTNIVEINKATIEYADNVILSDVSWKINSGERWLLKGHNGAGKSTLLSLINADNPQAYSKDITLFGRKRGTGESIFDIKRKIGFVSAELYQYFPGNTSCARIIESGFYDTMGLFRPSNTEKREKCLDWMKVLGISEFANSLFRNVPESAQRLCLLARALVKNPPLLILDEPCQGLDTDQQMDFKVLIETICRFSDIALIYVSHFQEEIPDCLTHALELSHGKIVSKDSL